MLTIAHHQADAYPDAYKDWQLRVIPLGEFAAGDLTRQYTLLLLGAVAFVLLIACADVANVQFARVSGRQKELAVRAAMGASRTRIVRQLLIESVMLSLFGAVLGIFLAQWMLTLMLSHMPPDIARYIAGWKSIRLDLGAFPVHLRRRARQRHSFRHRAFADEFPHQHFRNSERKRARRFVRPRAPPLAQHSGNR